MLVIGRPQIHLVFLVVVTIGGGGRQDLPHCNYKKNSEIAKIILEFSFWIINVSFSMSHFKFLRGSLNSYFINEISIFYSKHHIDNIFTTFKNATLNFNIFYWYLSF